MCKSTDKSLLSTMHINKERNILGVVGELIKFHMLYLITKRGLLGIFIQTLITTTFLIPCGGVHLEELELCENVYFFVVAGQLSVIKGRNSSFVGEERGSSQ